MDDRERIERLEAQVLRIETELHNLMHAIDRARAEDAGVLSRTRVPPRERGEPVEPVERVEPVEPPASSADSGISPHAVVAPEAYHSPPPKRGAGPGGRDLESWFGENALLVVGVLALVAAVGFTLKHAFEQGWVSPPLRVVAGLVFGLALAAYGARARKRGLHAFGAAAIGAGAAIAYLAIWAAAGPYALIPSMFGIAALAVLSSVVLLTAWRIDEQYLAAIAATGAYLAPIVIGDTSTSPNLLLGYSALISAAAGPIAVLRDWRMTAGIVIAGFFWPAILASGRADAAWVAAYLAGGGAIAVAEGRRLGWRAHEAAAWIAAWFGLLVTSTEVTGWRGWAYVVAPALLVAPGWIAAQRGGDRRWLVALSASLWVTVALIALPFPADQDPIFVVGLIGLLYAVPGLVAGAPTLLAVGVGVLSVGALAQWDGTDTSLAWAALIGAVALTTRREPLSAARPAGIALGVLASLRLVLLHQAARAADTPAFLDEWALAWYALLAALVALASAGWVVRRARFAAGDQLDLLVVAWLLAGTLLLVGGTLELTRLFDRQMSGTSGLAELAAGLSVSVFWLLYAGALLVYGFREDQRAVRVTGLVVASLAVVKVMLYDLANLEALYRIGSFAVLAVITLLGAQAYHRRARGG